MNPTIHLYLRTTRATGESKAYVETHCGPLPDGDQIHTHLMSVTCEKCKAAMKQGKTVSRMKL